MVQVLLDCAVPGEGGKLRVRVGVQCGELDHELDAGRGRGVDHGLLVGDLVGSVRGREEDPVRAGQGPSDGVGVAEVAGDEVDVAEGPGRIGRTKARTVASDSRSR